jgi:hypothetical protein
MSRKLVLLLIAIALMAGAVSIGAKWWTDPPSPTTLDHVREQARQVEQAASTSSSTTSTTAGPHSPSPTTAKRIIEARTYQPGVPVVDQVRVPEGIYAYETRGSEKVHLGPGQSHTYPAETFIRYTPTSCGFEAVWEPLDGRKNVYRICVEPFTLVTYEQHHAFFGQTDHRSFYCDPPLHLDVTGRGECWQEGKSVRILSTVHVDRQVMTVGNKSLMARHVTIDAVLTGDANGTQKSEWWFSENDLLLLQVVSVISTDAKTILGGIRYTEDVTLKLKSLEPVG